MADQKRSRIVVPVDPERKPTAAIAVAATLARQADLAVEVVAARPEGVGGVAVDRHLLERCREAEELGAPETSWRELGSGDPAELVCGALQPDDVAMVCLATRSRRVVGELVLGSVADAVVRQSPVPVVLVGPHAEATDRFTEVVVALDGSQLAERAAHVAAEVAARVGAELFLLEVIGTAPIPEDLADTAYLARFAATLPSPPGRYDTVRSSRPGRAIVDASTGSGEVLLAVGTHGRTALLRLVLGSVAHDVVHRAHAPVLVVPRSAAEWGWPAPIG